MIPPTMLVRVRTIEARGRAEAAERWMGASHARAQAAKRRFRWAAIAAAAGWMTALAMWWWR
jgi:hypothetical protein